MVSLGDDFSASVDTCSAVVNGAPHESGLQIVRLILALSELWFTALAGVFKAPGLWPLVPGSHLFDAVCF